MTILMYVFTVGDIWSENGCSLLGLTSYRICRDWVFHEDLLAAIDFSNVAHTGENIKEATQKILHDRWKIGSSLETAMGRIHACTPDEGSSMLKAWEGMEGSGCMCHRQSTCLKHALNHPEVISFVKQIKGIASHFNRSDKVFC